MARYYATQYFTGDGQTTRWNISFAGARPDTHSGTTAWFKDTDVKAATIVQNADGTETETEVAVTIVGPTQVDIVPAIAKDVRFKVYRQSEREYPLVDFQDYSALTAAELDEAFRQTLFGVQELSDLATYSDLRSIRASTVAQSSVDKANYAVNTAVKADATASAANDTANAANHTANTAKELVDQAVSTANSASNTANSIAGTASDAKNIAESAKSTAESANGTANSIAGTAHDALSTAQRAESTAHSADTTANEAKTVAGSVDSKAQRALDTADQATTRANSALSTAQNLDNKVSDAQRQASAAETSAASAKNTAGNALNAANDAKTLANKKIDKASSDIMDAGFDYERAFMRKTSGKVYYLKPVSYTSDGEELSYTEKAHHLTASGTDLRVGYGGIELVQDGKRLFSVYENKIRDATIASSQVTGLGSAASKTTNTRSIYEQTGDTDILASTAQLREVINNLISYYGGPLSMAFAAPVSGPATSYNYGDTCAGADLRPCSAGGEYKGSALQGTWRCLGGSSGKNATDKSYAATFWIRVS